jgi:hypothetical protein
VAGIDDERSGLMILRAWLETNSGDALRVRIIWTTWERGEPWQSATSTVEGVCAQVRAWLEELAADRTA